LAGRKPRRASRGKAVARVLRDKARSNANRARLVKDLPIAEIGDEAFANDVQQAVEKCLKAAIAWTNATYPFSHDVGRLIEVAEKAELVLPVFDRTVAKSLTEFAGSERYETARTGPPLDRAAMLKLMELIETWVDRLMASKP
jgi:HEPN domain-containing protein